MEHQAAKEGKLEQQRGRKGGKKEKKERRARGRNMKGSDRDTERREVRKKKVVYASLIAVFKARGQNSHEGHKGPERPQGAKKGHMP